MTETPNPLAWPADLTYGIVVGRFVYLDGDSDDAGDEPDLIPAAGGIELQANAALATYLGESAALTAIKRPVVGVIDSEGYLCRRNPNGTPGARGIPVVATDNDTLSTSGFNYRVTMKIVGATIPQFNISVLGGQSTDLATVIPQAASSGTVVHALTAEVRAEIARALESVTVDVDTSGLVTTEALAAAGYIDEQQAGLIALDNALLNEGEVVREIQVLDGAYLFLTSTGREITAPVPEGAAVYDSGVIDITSQVPVGCAAAWMRRVGDRVTAVLYDVNFNEGGEVFWPGEGFRIASFTDQFGGTRSRVISSVMRDSDGVAEVLGLPGMWSGGFFWNAHVGKQAELDAASLPSQVDSLRYEWFTNDLPPVAPATPPAEGA